MLLLLFKFFLFVVLWKEIGDVYIGHIFKGHTYKWKDMTSSFVPTRSNSFQVRPSIVFSYTLYAFTKESYLT